MPWPLERHVGAKSPAGLSLPTGRIIRSEQRAAADGISSSVAGTADRLAGPACLCEGEGGRAE